ncbi:conserved hypothetical protein [Alkaliphilus metalliredigens QYMF]|uniref:Dockerin type 1 n=1 Tax=Alkaliphilus metalliredigens (strain QYMF) TaxID=293826 RepID=A6TPN9_ALKMQ|nr:carbohydrate-binding domain-containing protein [Alkaliphilus metalliredigens]ABR48157.1 conserved hypothetical protein [Alkaliphilus metalliredigens QYMF]
MNRKLIAVLAAAMVMMTACDSSGHVDTEKSENQGTNTMMGTITSANRSEESKITDEMLNFDKKTDTTTSIDEGNEIIINLNDVKVGEDVVITEGGSYILSGKMSNGQVRVEVDKSENVQLILDDVEITNEKGAAIYIISANKTIITALDGTENWISDGYGDVVGDIDMENEVSNAAIYSKDDLIINGAGMLTVNATINNGINSRDDLTISIAAMVIHAVDDAIVGRDSVMLKEVDMTINAGDDGIKSSREEEEKGYIVIESGRYNIQSQGKGMNAETSIVILGGEITIDAVDDGIHSNGTIDIMGGNITITTGDDGIHADDMIIINGGDIKILDSYEGIESAMIYIHGGNIDIVASDDGINAAGAGGQGGFRRMPNMAVTDTDVQYKLVITGGIIKVNAEGDGIDANGYIYMSGGEVYIDGPTNNREAAIDYDISFEMSGGLLVGAGSSSMAQAPSTTSTQASIAMTYSEIQSTGTEVVVLDEAGNNIISYAPDKVFQSIVFSTPDMIKGEEYTVVTNGDITVSFETADSVTWVNESGVTTGGGMGGPGGQRPEGMRNFSEDMKRPEGMEMPAEGMRQPKE